MASNVTDRSVVRKAFAALLRTALVGTGLPCRAVWDYERANFRGLWPVTIVTDAASDRTKIGQDTSNQTDFDFDVHNFVLFSEKEIKATNNPTAGSNVVVNISDTSLFAIGAQALISDSSNEEIVTINAIVSNVSIRAATLVHNYALPTAQSWTEAQSEDMLSLIEKMTADVISDNFVNLPTWTEINNNGPTTVEPLLVAGRLYRHEKMPIRIHVFNN